MAELDSDSVSSMIDRLVKQLLKQRCAAWRHACGHHRRDLLLLCSCKENENIPFEFAHGKLMADDRNMLERTRVAINHYQLRS